MKKILFSLFVLAAAASSCKKECANTMTYKTYEPVYMSYETLRTAVKSSPPHALKNTGKIYTKGNYLFVNEIDKGIHVIDNSNPSAPVVMSFIEIPGCVDMAVSGNTLYADSYIDLVSIDIANPLSVSEISRTENALPNRLITNGLYADPVQGVAIAWKEVEKTEKYGNDCNGSPGYGGPVFMEGDMVKATVNSGSTVVPNAFIPSSAGKGGSMARFTIATNYLYIVDHASLKTFSISGSSATEISTINLGWNIETIFPYQDKLFIGSQSGMFIYSISSPASPSLLGSYSHVSACDPVVVDGNYAYVTLRSGTPCQGFSNQMDIVDISNPAAPTLTTSYSMTNPHGLGVDNNTLFLCDGTDGLKVFDKTDVMKIADNKIAQFNNIQATDVIPLNNTLMMIGSDGLYQYDYSDVRNIRLISKITVQH
jgi:hypothetical protein